MKDKITAFTLIELLVVIVIIGILASLSVASFSSYFDKARIAKATSFAANSKKILYTKALEEGINNFTFLLDYDNDHFDDSGAMVYLRDKSGHSNDFEPAAQHFGNTGYLAVQSDDTPNRDGSSLDLNNSTYGFNLLSVNSENQPRQAGTFSSWFKYDSLPTAGRTRYLYYVYKSGGNSITLGVNTSGQFIFKTGIGNDYDITSSEKLIKESVWHHVLAAYDGSKMKLWIDSEFIGEQVANVNNIWGPGTMILGGPAFKGKLDQSDFYPVVFEDY